MDRGLNSTRSFGPFDRAVKGELLRLVALAPR